MSMIPFIDLAAQQARIKDRIDAAIQKVLAHGGYVMGQEVRDFEARLAEFGQSKLSLSCANGTDAIVLPLMAWGVGKGDAVFCPSFTFTATAEVIPWTEAEPVFIDILPDTFNMDPAHLEAAIKAVRAEGRLTPKVVIAVDLFGQPADYPAINAICDRSPTAPRAPAAPSTASIPLPGPTRPPPASSPPSRSVATATAGRC